MINAVLSDGDITSRYDGCSYALIGVGGNQICQLDVHQAFVELGVREESIQDFEVMAVSMLSRNFTTQEIMRDLCCKSCAELVEVECNFFIII